MLGGAKTSAMNARLTIENKQLRAQLTAMIEQLTNYTGQMDSLKSQLQVADQALATKATLVRRLQMENANLLSDLHAKDATIASLKASLVVQAEAGGDIEALPDASETRRDGTGGGLGASQGTALQEGELRAQTRFNVHLVPFEDESPTLQSRIDVVEQSTKQMHGFFKDIMRASKTFCDKGTNFSKAMETLGTAMTACHSNQEFCQRYSELATSMTKVGKVMVEIAQYQELLFHTWSSSFIVPIETFVTQEVGSFEDAVKLRGDAVVSFENALNKYLTAKPNISETILENKLDDTIIASRKLQLARFDLLRQANALEVRKTCGMLEHVCSALYGLRSFHHQAHDMLDVLHGSARSLQAGIQTAQTRATELQDVWIDHRRKLAVALDEAKDLDEIHDVVEQLAKDLLGAQYHTAVALMADDSKEGSNLSLSRVLSSPSADFVANADVLRGKGGDGDSDDDDEGPRTPKIAAAAGPPTPAAGLDATGGSSDTAPSGTAAPSHASVSAPVLMSGYLAKKSSGVRKDWKRRWFFVQDGRLWYFRGVGGEAKVISELVLCNIRECAESELRFAFELRQPNRRVYLLMAHSEKNRKEWVDCLRQCVESLLTGIDTSAKPASAGGTLSSNPRVREIQTVNPTCADCGAPQPDWASINLGVLICIGCSGIHRSLGVHISKVRSLTLDELQPTVIDLLARVGNDAANYVWEGNIQIGWTKPTAGESREIMDRWINAKYRWKGFISLHGTAEELGTKLYTGAQTQNFEQCYEAFAAGADINWRCTAEHNQTPLHVAAAGEDLTLIELLVQNGANLTATDDNNRTAYDIAMEAGQIAVATLLDKKLREL